MINFDEQYETLHSPFSIQKHKEIFVNYLEIIILENGTIEYAVPSHQERLIKYACDKLNISRDELEEKCPKEYYCDFIIWLSKSTGACAVWNNYVQGYKFSEAQIYSLNMLRNEGLYTGFIPGDKEENR